MAIVMDATAENTYGDVGELPVLAGDDCDGDGCIGT